MIRRTLHDKLMRDLFLAWLILVLCILAVVLCGPQ